MCWRPSTDRLLARSRPKLATGLPQSTGCRAPGTVFVHGSTLWLECSIVNQVPAGDHDIVILGIASLKTYPDFAPIVFHRSGFRELAPTP